MRSRFMPANAGCMANAMARVAGHARLVCCLVALGLSPGIVGAQTTPQVSFLFEQVEIGESVAGATATLTVVAEPAPASNIDVGYRFLAAQSSAAAPADFSIVGLTGNAGTVQLTPAAPRATLTVTLVDDGADEGLFEDALFELLVDAAGTPRYSLGVLFSTRLRIYDDDATVTRPQPRINFAMAESGGAEGTTVNVEVRATPPPTGALTISYAAMPAGTATSAVDYTALSGSLTLAANVGSVTLPVVLTDDADPEPVESLVLLLQAGSGYTLGSRRRHRLTIEDNDLPVISFAQAASTVAEPEGESTRNDAQQNATTIVLNVAPVPRRPLWVGYRVSAAGTASAGPDYLGLAAPGDTSVLRFEAGEASRSVALIIPSDPLREGTETMILELLAPADDYTLGTQTSHTLSITDSSDDGSLPVVRFGSSAPVEVDDGGVVNIPLVAHGLESATLNVSLAVVGDQTTAEAADYTLPAATIVSTATGTMVRLQTHVDLDLEDELLVLQIADSSAYATARDRFADTSYVLRIRDTGLFSSGPTVQFVSAGSIARESQDGRTAITHTVALQRTGATTGTLSVMVAAVGRGDAVQGVTDFSVPSTTVTFATGQARAELTVTVNADNRGPDSGGEGTINQDGAREGEQLVDLLLLPGSGYQLGDRRHHRVTISEGYRLTTGGFCSLADGRGCEEAAEGDVLVFSATSLVRFTAIRSPETRDLLNQPPDVPLDIFFCTQFGIPTGDSSDPRDGLDFIVLNGRRVANDRLAAAIECRTDDDTEPGTLFLVTVQPGQVSPRVLVEIVDDDEPENEAGNRFIAQFLPVPDSGVDVGSGGGFPFTCNPRGEGPPCAIADNDQAPPPTPSVAFTTATTVMDENAGTVSIPLTVTDTPAQGLVIDYRVSGSAQLGTDYTIDGVPAATRRGSLAVPPDGTAGIDLWLTDDRIPGEPERSLVLELQPRGDAYTLGAQAIHTLTIEDDDVAGALTGVSFAVGQLEVNEGGGSVTVQVRAVPPTATGVIPGGSFNIPYRLVTAETTAPASLYTISGGSTGTLSFSDSTRTQELTVTLNDNSDEDTQPTRSLVLELLQPQPVGDYLVMAPNQLRIVINDDDGANMPTPRINFSLVESGGAEGATVNVEVVSIPPPAAPLTISYNAAPAGTATSGVDYTALSGSLTLTTGSVNLPVVLLTDGVPEPPESLVLMLQAGGGYTLGSQRQHRLTIEDADFPVISFATPTSGVTEPTGQDGRFTRVLAPATITLNVAPLPHRPIWVGYRVNAAGTASAGSDYLGLPVPGDTGSLRFEASEASRTIALRIPVDQLREGTETLILELLAPTDDYTLGAQTSHTLSITDDSTDGSLPVVRFGSAQPVEVDEGGAVNIPLLADALEGVTLSVSLQVDGGQSTAENADYTLPAAAMVSTATGTMVQLQTNTDMDTDDEVLVLQIADSSAYATARDRFAATSYVLRILDTGATASGPTVQFVSAGSSVQEPDPRMTNTTNHRVTLERDNTAGTLTVMLAAVARGAAVEGDDYSVPSTTVTFNAGQARADATVTIRPDAGRSDTAGIQQGEQLVELLLLPGSDYQLGARTRHRVTIRERLRLTSGANCVLESDPGRNCLQATEGDVLSFSAQLLHPFAGTAADVPTLAPIDVHFCVSDSTSAGIGTNRANPNLNFIILNAVADGRCRRGTHPEVNGNGPAFRLTSTPGQTRIRLLVEVVDDDRPEMDSELRRVPFGTSTRLVPIAGDHHLLAEFHGVPGSPVETVISGDLPLRCDTGTRAASEICIITDNDPAPPPTPSVAFATATSTQLEDAGTVSIPLTVANPPAAGLVIDYQVTGGAAQLNADYTIDGLDPALRAQTVVTGAGGSINVNLVDDGQSLPDITLELTLLAPGGAEATYVPGGVARHTLTIGNDDATVSPPVPVGRLPAQQLVAGGAPASVDVSAAFRDPNEDDVLTYSALSDAEAVATVSVSGAIVSITPLAAGSATVTVTARDPGGLTAEQTIAVMVAASPVPVFAADTVADQTYLRLRPVTPLTLPAADGGVGALSYGLAPLPAGFSFDPAARVLSGTPTAAAGQTTLTYTVTDTEGNSARQTFTITLQELTATTIDGAISGTVTEDGVPTAGATLSVLDSNGVAIDSATFSATGGLAGTYGSFSLTMGGGGAAWVYVLDNDNTLVQQLDVGDSRQDTLALQAVAGGSLPNPPAVTLTVTIAGAEDTTVATITAPTAGMLVESAATTPVAVALTDVDAGDPAGAITYLWSTAPAGQGSFANATAASTTWTAPTVPANDGNIELRVAVMVEGETVEAGVRVLVNLPPRFAAAASIPPQSYQAGMGVPALTLPPATGGNGALSYRITPALPAGLSFDSATRVLSGTPDAEVAQAQYTYIAADGDAITVDTDEARLSFSLEVVGDTAPSFSETIGTLTLITNVNISTTLPAAMGGNGALSYRITPASLPARLRFDPATRVLSGDRGVVEDTQHTYIAADSDANTANSDEARQTFTISVEADRSPSFSGPALLSRSYQIGERVNEVLPAATGGNGALTYSFSRRPPGLNFDPETRLLSGTVQPPPDSTTGSYRATDADGDRATVTILFTITASPVFISATNPAPLTEASLNGATLTVTLGTGFSGAIDDITYESTLTGADFTLNAAATDAGISVANAVVRLDDNNARLTLVHDGTDFGDGDVDITVTVLARATSVATNITTFPVAIRAAGSSSNTAPPAPVLADQMATVDRAFSYTFAAVTDPDGDAVSYAAALSGGGALPGWLSFAPAGRAFSGTPAAGDAGTLTIQVTATDDGAPPMSATADFTLTVAAVAVTIGGATTGTVTEDGTPLTIIGTLTVTTASSNKDFVEQRSVVGIYGNFDLGSNGDWFYTLDNADPNTNALAAGATAEDVFTVAAAANPAATGDVTITVNGANDRPTATISAPAAPTSAIFGAAVPVTGSGTDPDAGETASLSHAWTTVPPGQGSFAMPNAASTIWTAGAPAIDDVVTLTLTVTDTSSAANASHSATVAVTVTAAPLTISGPDTGAVTEDATATASNTLAIANPNPGGVTTFVEQIGTDGSYGLFEISSVGVWTYTLGGNTPNQQAVNALAAGATPTDTFTVVASADRGVTQVVTITVNGANDRPTATISAPAAPTSAMFGAAVTVTGSGTDPDAGETASLSHAWTTVPPGQGSFAAPNAASTIWTAGAQSIDDVVTLTLTVTDTSSAANASHSATVAVTVTAAPVTISGPDTGAVTEDGTVTASNTLAIANPNPGGVTTFVEQTDTDGSYGLFAITSAGVWTYTLGGNMPNQQAVNALPAGATPTDVFTVVASADRSVTQVVTITVNGANDRPTANAGNAQTVAANAVVTLDGSASFDPDTGDTIVAYTWMQSGGTNVVLDDAAAVRPIFTAPGTGEELEFSLVVNDGTVNSAPSTVTITVTGDPTATITATNPGTLTEALLNGATLTVTLSNATYTGTPTAVQFTLTTDIAGLTVDSLNRDGAMAVTLTLAHDGTDLTMDESIGVTVVAAAHSGTDPLPTAVVMVTDNTEPVITDPGAQTYVQNVLITPLTITVTDAEEAGSLSVTVTGLPTGLAFNGTDEITGTPTDLGESMVTITAGDGVNDDVTATFTITVTAPALSFGGEIITDQTYTMGTPITDLTLPAATGGTGPYSYGLSGMPSGLAFDSDTRVLSGTPDTEQAATTYTYTATDSATPSATMVTLAFTIEVAAAPTATISATDPDPLIEATLDGATLTVTLTGTTYASPLSFNSFSLNIEADTAGISVRTADRDSDTQATLTLTYAGPDFDDNIDIIVTVLASGHTGADSLTTGAVTAMAVIETSRLGALALSAGVLTPVFNAEIFDYIASVVNSVDRIAVTPTVAAGVEILVNGNRVNSGDASQVIMLNVGSTNVITVIVTGAIAPAQTYTITITRAAAPTATISATNPGTLTEANLDDATLTVTLANTTYANPLPASLITLNTAAITAGVTATAVRDSATEATLTLAFDRAVSDFDDNLDIRATVPDAAHSVAGNLSTGAVTVTAVVESSDATLAGLSLSGAAVLAPVFAPTTLTYTANVANDVAEIMVTPTATDAAGATIAVNGTAVNSGAVSTAIALTAGVVTPITVLVTAEDGTTQTYTLAVTRAAAPTAAIATPALLTEAALNGATVTVMLTNTEYVPGVLAANLFTVTLLSGSGVTVSTATRTSEVLATLTLAYGGTGIDANTTLGITVLDAAHSGTGNLDTATIPVTATPPSLPNASFSVAENAAANTIVGAPLVPDNFPTGSQTWAIVSGNTGNDFAIDTATGQLSVAAADAINFEDTASYTLVVSLTVGAATEQATVTVTVTDEDEPPAAPAAPTVAPAAESLNVSWTAPANSGPAITGYDVEYRLTSSAPSGAYTDAGHSGTTLAITITGLTASMEYQVQVRAVNAEGMSAYSAPGTGTPLSSAAPTATISATDPVSLTEANLNDAMLTVTLSNATYTGTLTAPQFTLAGAPGGAMISVESVTAVAGSDTQAVLVLAYPEAGADLDSDLNLSVVVAAAAHSGDDPLTTAPVTVADNAAPVIVNPGSQSYVQNAPITALMITVTDADGDADGDPPLVTLMDLPNGLLFDGTDQVTGTPTELGDTEVTITAVDGVNDMVTATFTITVNAAALSFGGAAITAQTYTANTAITDLTLPAATGGTGTLSYALSDMPSGLAFDAMTRVLSGTPDTVQAATSYTYTATDMASPPAMVTLSFTIEVAAGLGFGGATIDDQTYVMGAAITDLTLPAATGGTGPYSYALSDMPSGLAFDAMTRVLSGTPNAVQALTTYTYTATDAATPPAMVTLAFSITIAAPPIPDTNGPPTFAPGGIPPLVYVVGAPTSNLQLVDASGGDGELVYSIDPTPALPPTLSFNPATRDLSGDPATAVFPAADFTYRVADSDVNTTNADTDTLIISIEVEADVPPAFALGTAIPAQRYTVNTAITPPVTLPVATGGNERGIFGDPSPITYTITPDLPAGLTFNAAATPPTITGTPQTVQTTASTHTYRAADEDANTADSDAATLNFTVTILSAPVVISGETTGAVTEDAATATATGTLTVTNSGGGGTEVVAQTDDGTYGTFSIVADTRVWTYTLNNAAGSATDVLAANAMVTDVFTVVAAADPRATTDVTITITGANDAPSVTISAPADDTDVAFGTALTLTATGEDVDSGTTLSYAWSANPDVGSFADAAVASTTWTAPAGGTDPVTLTLTVTDDATPPLSGTAEVTVNPVAAATPSAAIATPSSLTEATLEGATVTVMLTSTEYVGTLAANLFGVTLSGGATGVTVSAATRTSAVLATLTLAYGGTGIDANTTLGVRVGAAAHSGAGDLDTATIPVTATPPSLAGDTFTVAENTAAATTVGTPLVADNFPAGSQAWAIVSGNVGNDFNINPSTGQLSVAADDALNFEDTASYTLMVSLTVGAAMAQATVTLTVTDVDEPPAAPAAPTVTPEVQSLTVIWTAPANSGPAITGYDVEYRLTSSAPSGAYIDAGHAGTTPGITITGLTASVEYQVRVRAANAEGDGPYSAPGSGTPLAPPAPTATISAPATAIAEAALSGATLAVTLSNAEYAGTLAATQFTINHGSGASGVTVSGVVRTSATVATLTLAYSSGIDADTTLGVTLAAAAHSGDDALTTSNTVAVTATPASLTGATFSVAENTAADTDVGTPLVAAEFPAGTPTWAIVSGNTGSDFSIAEATGQLTVAADDALNFEDTPSYTLLVSLMIGAATAQATVMVTVGDEEEPPAAPAAPTVAAAAASLNVTWTAPANSGPAITRYDVQFRTGADAFTLASPGPGTATSLTITGLTAATLYDVQVRAANAEGDGPYSASGSGTTLAAGAPTATISATDPLSLTEANLNDAMLTVTLSNATYMGTLTASQFTLAGAPGAAMISVESVTAVAGSDTQAVLVLAYPQAGADLDSDLNLSVVVAAAAHSGDDPLTTAPVTVADNAAPVIVNPGSQSYVQNAPITALTITVTDADGDAAGDPPLVTLMDLPNGLLFDGTNQVTGTPTALGDTEVIITAADGVNDMVTDSFTITVNAAALSFGGATIAAQTYTMDTAITDLTLPVAGGGTGALSYAIAETLPTGLNFDAATRVLAGTPDTVQAATTHTYTVTDSAVPPVVTSLTFTITVNAPALSFGVATIPAQTYTMGTAITDLTLPAAGGGTGRVSYAITEALPTGLGFNAFTRVLSGTPDTAQAATTYTYTAMDSALSPAAVTLELVITVNAPALSFGGATITPQTYTANTAITDLTLPVASGGTGTLGYSLSGMPSGLNFSAATRVLSGTPNAAQALTTYTYTATDSALSPVAVTLNLVITVNAPAVALSFGGATIPPQTYTANTAITDLTLPAATGGTGALGYSLSGMPSGLNFSAATRVLSGIPDTAQALTTYTYTATDSALSPVAVTLNLVITVNAPAVALSFGGATIPAQTYTMGTAITDLTLPAAGGGTGALRYSLSGMPTGLNFNATTRVLSGTPNTAQAVTTYIYTATDADSTSVMLDLVITVNAPAAALTFGAATIAAQTYTANTAITDLTLPAVTGGTGPYVYTLSGMPSGLNFNATTRVLSGVPNTARALTTYIYTATDADSPPVAVMLDLVITVNAPAVALTFGAATIAAQTYTASTVITDLTLPAATGGTGTLRYSLSGMPSGLNFNATTRVLSGVPNTAQAATTYIYTATDADATTVTLNLVITVAAPGAPTATISATNPVSLTEVNLNGAMLTVTLGNATYSGTPVAGQFSLTTNIGGLTVGSLSRDSNTAVTLTLTYDGTDLTMDESIGVTLAAAAHSGTAPVTTTNTARVADNVAPVITDPGSQSYVQGTLITPLQITVDDRDGDAAGAPPIITVIGLPSGLIFNPAQNQITGTPDATVAAMAVTITAADGVNDMVMLEFAITVVAPATPVISGTLAGTLVEDAPTTTASGTLTISNPGSGATTFTPQTTSGTYGGFSIVAGGGWSYALNNSATATDELAAGVLVTDTFEVRAVNAAIAPATVTISITGANDAPTATAGAAPTTVASGGTVALTGSGADPDTGAVLVFQWSAAGNAGTFTNANRANASWNAPRVDSATTIVITLTVSDGAASAAATVNLMVLGNQPSVIGGDLTGAASVAVPTATGTLTSTDSDGPDNSFTAAAGIAGTFGTLSITDAGRWSYTLDTTDADTIALAAAQTAEDTLTISAADGTVARIIITVTGANDAPLADAGDDRRVAEGVQVRLDGTASRDPDGDASLRYSWTQSSGTSVLLSGADTATATFTSPELPAGSSSLELEFRLAVSDADGETGEDTVTITVGLREEQRRQALTMTMSAFGRAFASGAVSQISRRFAEGASTSSLTLGGRTVNLRSLHEGGRPAGGGRGREMSINELLSRSAFRLSFNRHGAIGGVGSTTVWARGSSGNYGSEPTNGFILDGDVTTAYLGMDHRLDSKTLLGIAVARSEGEMDFTGELLSGEVDTRLTSLLPYAHWQLSKQLRLWGLLGYGEGDVTLADDTDRTQTDIQMRMAALGLHGSLVSEDRFGLSMKASALTVGIDTDDEAGLSSVESDARRLRMAVEGVRRGEASAHGARFQQSLEVGLRWDDGDAESGAGADLGMGLEYANPRIGVSVRLDGHYLLAHEEEDFSDWGLSAAMSMDPGQRGRGVSFTLEPSWNSSGSRQGMGVDFSGVFAPAWKKQHDLRLELYGERAQASSRKLGLRGSFRF